MGDGEGESGADVDRDCGVIGGQDRIKKEQGHEGYQDARGGEEEADRFSNGRGCW